MSVIRIKKKRTPYVTLDTTALNDPRLSFRAKGLHAYLLSKPDDWQVYIAHLEEESPREGKDAIRGAIKELEAAGAAGSGGSAAMLSPLLLASCARCEMAFGRTIRRG